MKKALKIILPIIFVAIMLVVGYLLDGGLLGTVAFVMGITCIYFNSQGKWYSYFFGIIYTIITAIIYYKNGQFGAVTMSVIFYEPMLIGGLINWLKHKSKDTVIMKDLSVKQSIIIYSIIVVCSIVFGLILSKISGEKNAFTDAFSQSLNVSANLLLILRFRQCWNVWIVGGFVDIFLWTRLMLSGGENSLVMLISAFIYFGMNIYGYISWRKIKKNQNKLTENNN